MKIFIDNGHGRDTAGKRSPDRINRPDPRGRDCRVSVAINIKTVGIAEIFQPNNDYLNLVFYICRKIANIKNKSIIMDSYQLKAGLTPAK